MQKPLLEQKETTKEERAQMIPPIRALDYAEFILRKEINSYASLKKPNWGDRRNRRHLVQAANFLKDTVALSRMGFLKRKVKR